MFVYVPHVLFSKLNLFSYKPTDFGISVRIKLVHFQKDL